MDAKRPVISFTSDFGVQSQGVGAMEGTALGICPQAKVIHLMHGLPDFDRMSASRTMETVKYLPVGCHVCVVDPGVGTRRKALIIKANRGDYLIGPDNGVLISAAKALGGCAKVVEISNPTYMRQPVSPIFHGRDVFAPAAAHLSNGVPMDEFGKELKFEGLMKPPYGEARVSEGDISAEVILVNKFGSVILNVLQEVWDKMGIVPGDSVVLTFEGKMSMEIPFVNTFGEVEKGRPLIMKDDYGRSEIAINHGSFAGEHGISVGDKCAIRKKQQ